MTSSRRKMLSLIAVPTVLALFAWVAPGQTEALPLILRSGEGGSWP